MLVYDFASHPIPSHPIPFDPNRSAFNIVLLCLMVCITADEVLTFVHWDLYHNTLFEVWGVVLRQARKGVPIGGYLSA